MGDYRFHGSHLLIDVWGARHLADSDRIQVALANAASRAGAKVLFVHLHKFEPHGGVTGVAVLAESHISIHTWPENSYAALDVFMCGQAEPERTIPIFEETFHPRQIIVTRALRGAYASVSPNERRNNYLGIQSVTKPNADLRKPVINI